MSDPDRPVVTGAHTKRARELLDAWLTSYAKNVGHPLPNAGELLSLRGQIAVALTETFAEAYDAGLARGYNSGYDDALNSDHEARER